MGFAGGDESAWPKQTVAPATAVKMKKRQVFMKAFVVALAVFNSVSGFRLFEFRKCRLPFYNQSRIRLGSKWVAQPTQYRCDENDGV